MAQIVSIKDTRNNLANIIDQVAIGQNTFVITKFGKPRAMIIPVSGKKVSTPDLDESFGTWSKKTDITDTTAWVTDLRMKMSTRND